MKTNANIIGKTIKKNRKIKNLTQKQLALKMSVSTKLVSSWEQGVRTPSINMISALVELLDIDIIQVVKAINKNQIRR